ncbi:MAG: alkaline phosphatase, partial [Elusimicrobiota bacterium]
MATGVKTTNGALGVDVDGIVLESVLERAQKLGKRVGLVTTDTIVGATPSGFGAHVVSRKMKDKIPEQFLAKKINVLFGGGAESFKAKEGGSDKIQDFINAGYIVARTKDELNKINAGKVALALGLFSEKEVDYYQTRASTVPSLVDMTIKALEILSRDEDGFFLMIEGARIDHAAHINDAKRLVDELLEFDNTISVVEQYIKRNPDTLLIVTADHETGSPVFDYPYKYKKPEELEELKQLKNIHWIGKEHTSAPLMLFGIGPGAEQLRGMHDNTCVANIIFQALSQAGGTKTGGK